MKIKGKLLLINNIAIITILLIGSFIIYSNLMTMTKNNLEKQLRRLNRSYFSFIKNTIYNSVVSYMNFKTHQHLKEFDDMQEKLQQGKISEKRFLLFLKNRINKIRIAKTGYMFVVDKNGNIITHKDKNKIGKNITSIYKVINNLEMTIRRMNTKNFIKFKMKKNSLFFEFIDNSINVTNAEKSALYGIKFQYGNYFLFSVINKTEFPFVIEKNINDIMRSIASSITTLENYYFILDKDGYMISHKNLSDVFSNSFLGIKDLKGKLFIKEMVVNKKGTISYLYKNPADKFPRVKVAQYDHLKMMDWVVVTVTNRDDLFKPIIKLRMIIIIFGLTILVALLLIILWTSSLITRPIRKLMTTIYHMREGNLTERADIQTKDEIGELGKAFNNMADTIQDHTENLERKVQKRTQELQNAYEEVSALNEQQAGDYFLTSLLLNPLVTKRYNGKDFKLDFYLSQKKKFQFRKREGEIGGDINIAHRIELKGKKYSVFVNGDAMGKSLQGSGGAIVLGVVFNAFVERTKELDLLRSFSPERWLRECYCELQSVFESFDGSMLISVVIGMIDEISGLLYYFNAEHPWCVVYRNEKSSFIQNELDVRKIGTVGFENELRIRTFQLKENDMVFIGSDGRDDIMTARDAETGIRIINEDENLFLKTIEKAEGEIDSIIFETEKLGELTDDISIIKVTYDNVPEWKNKQQDNEFINAKNKADELFNSNKENEAISEYEKAVAVYPDEKLLKILIKWYSEHNYYKHELEKIEKLLWYHPGKRNTLYIYRASVLNKKINNFLKAVDFGEDFRNHFPENVNNLINLSDTYRLMKDYIKAKEILLIAEDLEKDNEYLPKVRELLESEMTKND